MTVCHDHLLQALLGLEKRLLAGEIIEAEVATSQVLQLLAQTTEPAADPRLRPVFGRCQHLADQLRATLEEQLREAAASSRAVLAYERESGDQP